MAFLSIGFLVLAVVGLLDAVVALFFNGASLFSLGFFEDDSVGFWLAALGAFSDWFSLGAIIAGFSGTTSFAELTLMVADKPVCCSTLLFEAEDLSSDLVCLGCFLSLMN